jgi:hypothetical protein
MKEAVGAVPFCFNRFTISVQSIDIPWSDCIVSWKRFVGVMGSVCGEVSGEARTTFFRMCTVMAEGLWRLITVA